jgi:aldehyde dehydrogenase (NAD+)
MAETFKNFIAGEWVAPSTGEYFENRNPADWNDVIGLFPRSGADDLKRAVASAAALPNGPERRRRSAARSSTRRPDPRRAQGRHRACHDARNGKVVAETKGDLQEGIDTAFTPRQRVGDCLAVWCPRSCAASGR